MIILCADQEKYIQGIRYPLALAGPWVLLSLNLGTMVTSLSTLSLLEIFLVNKHEVADTPLGLISEKLFSQLTANHSKSIGSTFRKFKGR